MFTFDSSEDLKQAREDRPTIDKRTFTLILSPDTADAWESFKFPEPVYDVQVTTKHKVPEPPEPQEPAHVPGFWAWLTGKNEKLYNDYLDEYYAWVEEFRLWQNRNGEVDVVTYLPNTKLTVTEKED